MKRVLIYVFGILMLSTILYSADLMANDPKTVLGTWSYEALQAPYPEYSKGQLILTEKEGKLHGQMKIGENARDLLNVAYENNVISFGTYLEGEYISIKVTVKDNTFSGKASYSEGSVELKGKKEK
jgi:hypothetical protein